MAKKKRKLRTDFRKNREVRARNRHRNERVGIEDSSDDDRPHDERISGKGAISRKRTVAGGEVIEDDAGTRCS